MGSAPGLPEVVVGVLSGFDESGAPSVEFRDGSRTLRALARTTSELRADQVGSSVVLAFERGDPAMPIVIGVLGDAASGGPKGVERLVLTAGREIVLRSGKASIKLSKDGTVTIQGEYLVSRASGVNRIKGGSVQIN